MTLYFFLIGVFCFAAAASAQFVRTTETQTDILRIVPDDSAAFVPMVMPVGGGGPEAVEVLSRQGEWEEVRLHYRFKYNGSADPDVCVMFLCEGIFTGYRKTPEKQPD